MRNTPVSLLGLRLFMAAMLHTSRRMSSHALQAESGSMAGMDNKVQKLIAEAFGVGEHRLGLDLEDRDLGFAHLDLTLPHG